jgi:RNA polymerase sigma-70 factor, ECF subfamily
MARVLTGPDSLDRPASGAVELELEAHRTALTGYCYRMLGSGFEAEDAVQETMVRAWRGADRLQSRAALKSWLYRIATNVCFDMLQGSQRRARPMDLDRAATADSMLDPGLPESAWIHPVADAHVLPESGDPAELAAAKETIRLAFVAALQHLPQRQRAVLILREVLHWQASEVAELLDTTVASVNSALQRARATIDAAGIEPSGPATVESDQEELLARYVDAFERYDVAELVSLLHEDATQTMPPFRLWLRGREEIGKWFLGQGIGCRGSRLVATAANGRPAFGVYRPSGPDTNDPFGIVILEISDGRIAALQNFIYPRWFAAFGLPPRLRHGRPAEAAG